MAFILSELALVKNGSAISLSLEPGQTLCVVGPAASGKSRLLRVLSGQEAPDRGTVTTAKRISTPDACNRKIRPQDLSHKKGENKALLATEVLSHLGLWEVRQKVISELAPAQIAACDLVALFMSGSELLIVDDHLDRLDPWTRAEALKLLRDRCNEGANCVVSTNQLDMASQFDFLVVMKDHQPLYAGSTSELASLRGQRSLTIESERNVGVRALVEPLLVGVTRTDSGYKLQPGPGQDQTAKLLRDGYGDVKFMVSDQRSLSEIILGMIS